jgi:Ca2+-binding EF-hand superfamily protein
MLRRLYIRLLWMHPAAFRQRFGDEMLEIFEDARGLRASARLIADGCVSCLRQWTLRREFRRPEPAAADALLFHMFEPYQPRPAALLNGGLLAMAVLCGLVLAIGRGGRGRAFSIGAHRSAPGLFRVDRAPVEEASLDTTVTVPPDAEDPARPIALAYFQSICVLGALDADGDLVISPAEIRAAPAALRRLDTDGDGSLSAGECGLREISGAIPDDIGKAVRREFMRVNPVLDALDADHDGEISAAEMANASAVLKKLDRNRDGSLTPEELFPGGAEELRRLMRLRAAGKGVR